MSTKKYRILLATFLIYLTVGLTAHAVTLLTVPQGGTGVGTITGLIKGNGTSPFSVATPGTDYATTLASVSALSTNTAKSLYTMTSTVPVEFRRSAGATLLYLDETSGTMGLGTSTLDPTGWGAGYTLLTQFSSTLASVYQIESGRTDADAALIGTFRSNYLTNSATFKEIGAINFVTDGATANKRGGAITFNTQLNNSAGLVERMRISNAGFVGIGVAPGSISARLHVLSTTEQIRTAYDASNYFSTTVSLIGAATFDAVGSGASFSFSDPVSATSSVVQTAPFIGTNTATGSVGTYAWAFDATTPNIVTGGGGTIFLFGQGNATNNKAHFDFNYQASGSALNAFEIGLYNNDHLFKIAGNGKGGIGLGTAAASAYWHVLGTTEQLRLAYDASNYFSTTVGSTGTTTFDAIGSGAAFNFNDNVAISSSATNTLSVTTGSGATNYLVANLQRGDQGANRYVYTVLGGGNSLYQWQVETGNPTMYFGYGNTTALAPTRMMALDYMGNWSVQGTSPSNSLSFIGTTGAVTNTAINTTATLAQHTITDNFIPTSGTTTYTGLLINTTVNQTGGSSGVTRGIYLNPTLTAAADWRGIESTSTSGYFLYQSGTAANRFGGSVEFPYVAKTANYTVTSADYEIDCTANTFTVTLPNSTSGKFSVYVVTNSGAGVITVTTAGGTQIVGNNGISTTATVAAGASTTFHATGTGYRIN